MVTHPFGDHAWSCLTLAFESNCSCSAPLTLLCWNHQQDEQDLDFVRCNLHIYSHKVKETAYKAVVSDHPWSTPVLYGTPTLSAAVTPLRKSRGTLQGGPCRTISWQSDIKHDCHAWRAGLAIIAVKKEEGQTHDAVQIQEWSVKYCFKAHPGNREPEEKSPSDQLATLVHRTQHRQQTFLCPIPKWNSLPKLLPPLSPEFRDKALINL